MSMPFMPFMSFTHCAVVLCFLAGLILPIPSYAAQWQDDIPQPRLVGHAELRWFGLRIYKAALWSHRVPFDPAQSFALELTYERSISRERLVQTSIDEIRRLSAGRFSDEQINRWQAIMSEAFVDVKEGDQLTGVYVAGVGCRFYSRERLLAEVRDLDFAHAFFAIWFDPRSKDQQLRRRLLGDDT